MQMLPAAQGGVAGAGRVKKPKQQYRAPLAACLSSSKCHPVRTRRISTPHPLPAWHAESSE